MQFYAYRLMMRDGFNTILRSGRLFQQYVVDEYAKIEMQCLNYVRYNQDKLRSDLYQGLED
ncbi:hypothetical protein ACP3WA_26600, partial [Salmonella enterica]|uniref:hypothetical protein n=1 Tax=Salmonella enterica TaxID=28901 RepID=UPI003CF4DE8C